MTSSPYREPAARSADRPAVPLDLGVTAAMVLVWLASLVRVVGALGRGEVLGAEPTLALLFTVVVPWVMLREARGARRLGAEGAAVVRRVARDLYALVTRAQIDSHPQASGSAGVTPTRKPPALPE
jgi:hypothetical protein